MEVDAIVTVGNGGDVWHGAFDGLREDAGLATEDDELDVGIGIGHVCLARQPVVVAKERFLVSRGVEGVFALPDLHDALVALAAAIAGGGYAHTEGVRILEDGLADNRIETAVIMSDRRHANSLAQLAGNSSYSLNIN